jgi:hypothetical protein
VEILPGIGGRIQRVNWGGIPSENPRKPYKTRRKYGILRIRLGEDTTKTIPASFEEIAYYIIDIKQLISASISP